MGRHDSGKGDTARDENVNQIVTTNNNTNNKWFLPKMTKYFLQYQLESTLKNNISEENFLQYK